VRDCSSFFVVLSELINGNFVDLIKLKMTGECGQKFRF